MITCHIHQSRLKQVIASEDALLLNDVDDDGNTQKLFKDGNDDKWHFCYRQLRDFCFIVFDVLVRNLCLQCVMFIFIFKTGS